MAAPWWIDPWLILGGLLIIAALVGVPAALVMWLRDLIWPPKPATGQMAGWPTLDDVGDAIHDQADPDDPDGVHAAVLAAGMSITPRGMGVQPAGAVAGCTPAPPTTPAGVADYTHHQPPERPGGGIHMACRMQWWAGHPRAACPDCAPRLRDEHRGPM